MQFTQILSSFGLEMVGSICNTTKWSLVKESADPEANGKGSELKHEVKANSLHEQFSFFSSEEVKAA